MTEETTALIVKDDLNVSVLFTQDGMQAILDEIRKKIDSFEVDIETDTGRQELKSFAYKVTRSKTLLDDIGKELGSDYKAKLDGINKFRKIARDTLDEWKDEVRKPLTEWEAEQERIKQAKVEAEMKRVESIKEKIIDIDNHGALEYGETSIDIEQRLIRVSEIVIDDSFMEFQEEVSTKKKAVIDRLNDALAKRITFEKEQAEQKAEADRLAKQKAEQDEKQKVIDAENARIAKEQAEAQAKIDAENKRIADEKAKLEAEKQAENDRKAREERESRIREEERIRAEQEAKVKAEREQKEREESERKQAERLALIERQKPDKDKIKGWLLNFDAMKDDYPEIGNNKLKTLFDEIREDFDIFISDNLSRVEDF